MSKRGRDLFELLEMRQGGGFSTGSKRSKKSRDPERKLPIGAWLAGLLKPPARKAAKAKSRRRNAPRGAAKFGAGERRAAAAGAPLSIPGMWLVAMLLVALGGGFVLGRGTAGAAAPDELRTAKKVGKMIPGRLPVGEGYRAGEEASDLGLQEEVATLSQQLIVVLNYYEHQKHEARDLLTHLRAHGLKETRLRLGTSKTTGKNLWSVVVYVLDKEQVDDYIQRILDVPVPDFDETGRFERRLKRPFVLQSLY